MQTGLKLHLRFSLAQKLISCNFNSYYLLSCFLFLMYIVINDQKATVCQLGIWNKNYVNVGIRN